MLVLEELFEDKKIYQDTQLYRFTSDSVLLSKFARAKYNDNVADFCAGSGIVGYHFMCLNPKISTLTLFEMQHSLAHMCLLTKQLNNFDNAEVIECKLQDIPSDYNDKFSLILCNPPYETAGFDNEVYEKAICRKEITITLAEIVEIAFRKLKFGGRLAIINRADRVAELIFLLKQRGLEPKRIQFVTGNLTDKPYLVMVEAVKGGKQGVEVAPTILNK